MAEKPPSDTAPNLRVLKPLPTQRAEDCVQLLEESLEHAKARPMVGVAVVMVDAERGMWFNWIEGEGTVQLIGALRFMERDIIEAISAEPPVDRP